MPDTRHGGNRVRLQRTSRTPPCRVSSTRRARTAALAVSRAHNPTHTSCVYTRAIRPISPCAAHGDDCYRRRAFSPVTNTRSARIASRRLAKAGRGSLQRHRYHRTFRPENDFSQVFRSRLFLEARFASAKLQRYFVIINLMRIYASDP